MNLNRFGNLYLFLFSIVIGLLSACGAVLFRFLIEVFQHLFWGSGAAFADAVSVAPWYMVLVIPALGGLVAGPFITFLVPEARGPGVTEIIKSVSKAQSHIRHRVTFLKAIVTSLLIGSGASVGREGPIAQIGASVGSSLSRIFNFPADTRRIFLAAGSAAGISATFNAPVAGTFFAIEIILMDIEITHMSLIMVSAITASLFSRLFWGEFPTFTVASFQMLSYWELLVYLVLGVSAGIVALAFVKSVSLSDSLFERIHLPPWIKPCIGGLLLGAVALLVPNILGVGYESINKALAGNVALGAAAILLAAKIIATAVCIGSGMSGGIFAPSLFLGGMLGTCVGFGAELIFPGLSINPAYYALGGMGAVVAGTTLAPMTAILTIFELTYDYHIILPLMVSCIISSVLVRALHGYSVYELKLLQQGVNIVRGRDISILRSLSVSDFMNREFESLHDSSQLLDIVDRMISSAYPHFVVLNHREELCGVLSLRDIKPSMRNFEDLNAFIIAADLMTSDVVFLTDQDNLEKALYLFEAHPISFMPVTDAVNTKQVNGILKKDALLQAYDERILKNRILSDTLR